MSSRDLVPGDVLDKYRLERLLGRGGMGEVWAAHDPDLDRKVALKVLRPEVAADAEAQARFQREGRAMARLRHPNVIVVHDAAFSGGRGLLAMELIDGQSLAAWLTTRRSPHEIVRVLVAAGHGLAAAHAAGMIHRDFKPHNVLIERGGRVVVTDFGLARSTGDPEEVALVKAISIAPTDPGDDPFSRSGLAVRAAADAAATTPADAALDATATPPRSAPHDAALDATATPPGVAPRNVELDATATPPGVAPRNVELDATATPARFDTTAASSASPGRTPRPSSGDLATPLTQTGVLLGTPAYMAPEQLKGEAADARADQFAFCVTAWEAFTGERPFRGRTFEELFDAVEHGQLGPSDRLPRRLRGLVIRGLAKDPAARWPDMDALLAALERTWRRPRRIAIGGGALAAAAAAATVVFIATRPAASAIEGCGDSAAAVASAWSPTIRAELGRALASSPYGDRTLAFFDRWATRWQDVHRANCAAPNDPDFAARRTCLDAVRDEVALGTELRSTIDPLVYGAPDTARLYPEPRACEHDPRGLAPAPPPAAIRHEVAVIRAELTKARATLVFPELGPTTVDVAALVVRARATQYPPVIVEAGMVKALADVILSGAGSTLGVCDRFGALAADADAAGYRRMTIEALLIQRDCVERTSPRDAPALLRRLDSLSRRGGGSVQRAQVEAQLGKSERRRGRYGAALELLTSARAEFDDLGLTDFTRSAKLEAGRSLFYRDRGDDLDRAVAELGDLLGSDLDPSARDLLREIAWRRGRIADAPPLVGLDATPAVDDPITVVVRVVDDRGPVAGAAIGAGKGLRADATRAAMAEVDRPVTAVTGGDGTVTLQVPRGAVILARAGDLVGAAAAIDRAGAQTIRIQPAAAISGQVSGLAATDDPDPGDMPARAAHRRLAIAIMTTAVGGRSLHWIAPIERGGSWRLPAVVPGHYLLSIQYETGITCEGATQTTIDVTAGTNVAPAVALDPAPRSIVAYPAGPAIESVIVAFPDGGPPPATWLALRDRLESTPTLALSELGAPTGDEAGLAADRLAHLMIGADATTVCLALGTETVRFVPLSRLVAGPHPPAPRCIVIAANAAAKPVEIPTGK